MSDLTDLKTLASTSPFLLRVYMAMASTYHQEQDKVGLVKWLHDNGYAALTACPLCKQTSLHHYRGCVLDTVTKEFMGRLQSSPALAQEIQDGKDKLLEQFGPDAAPPTDSEKPN